MSRRLALAAVVALLVMGCGSAAGPSPSPALTASPSPTATPTPTPAPSPSPSVAPKASADPFAGQPYTLDLPAGWEAFDLSATGKAGLDAFAKANPNLAGAIQAFASTPNVRMAVNKLLGNVMIAIAIPSQGLPMETIGQNLTAQFNAVLGLDAKAVARPLTLPAGPALHWPISISANKVDGGKVQVDESIYLTADTQTAVILEFVTPHGGTNPSEASIIKSLRLR